LECLTLILLLKAAHPNKVTMLRGNHECLQVAQVYGFYDECNAKYANTNVWLACTELFNWLSVGAVVDNKVFCVHAGIGPDLQTLDQIASLGEQFSFLCGSSV